MHHIRLAKDARHSQVKFSRQLWLKAEGRPHHRLVEQEEPNADPQKRQVAECHAYARLTRLQPVRRHLAGGQGTQGGSGGKAKNEMHLVARLEPDLRGMYFILHSANASWQGKSAAAKTKRHFWANFSKPQNTSGQVHIPFCS